MPRFFIADGVIQNYKILTQLTLGMLIKLRHVQSFQLIEKSKNGNHVFYDLGYNEKTIKFGWNYSVMYQE